MIGPDTVHGTCVALGQSGVLIVGAAGQGKSALALQLLALGCALVADDRVTLAADQEKLLARCPANITGLIEARGIGILTANAQSQAQIILVVDLDQDEAARLPERRQRRLLDCDIALIHRIDGPHFAAAILQILKSGWSDR